jgi:hypothetical protein
VSGAPLLDVIGCNGSRSHVAFHKIPDGPSAPSPRWGRFFMILITSPAQSSSECRMDRTLDRTTFCKPASFVRGSKLTLSVGSPGRHLS